MRLWPRQRGKYASESAISSLKIHRERTRSRHLNHVSRLSNANHISVYDGAHVSSRHVQGNIAPISFRFVSHRRALYTCLTSCGLDMCSSWPALLIILMPPSSLFDAEFPWKSTPLCCDGGRRRLRSRSGQPAKSDGASVPAERLLQVIHHSLHSCQVLDTRFLLEDQTSMSNIEEHGEDHTRQDV